MRRIPSLGRKTVEISTDGVPEGKVVIVEKDLGIQRSLRGGSRRLEIFRRQNSRGESMVASVSSSTGVKNNRKVGGRPNFVAQSLVNIKSREKDIVEVISSSCSIIPFLRYRCLVGTLVDWTGAIPSTKELECWCNSNCGIGSPVEVKAMNGPMYLFILPSRAESEELFRALGDRYGGYIMTAEETLCRDRVKWVSICVRGTGTLIPVTLSIRMGLLAYLCPTWVESGARVVHRSEPTKY
ncbi:hypothetical protein Acr_06g0005360 [Actinidia rufa]|uniref:Uncharacterized protein n=1 Tax=Actinidia rufa TaxID=165716 RepID=A0A7J0EQY1_9ERIC|nr:hypothetical protein Acr_06g0005360 [Actinidia rufa]